MAEKPNAAAYALIRSLESNPLDLSLYLRLSAVYVSNGEYDKARLTLRRAIEIDPLCHEAWIELGGLHSNLAQWRDSADAFERACSLAPGAAVAWIGLGAALIGTQDLSRAIEVRDVLLQEYPHRAESHLIAGHISKVQGYFNAAVDSYRRAIELDPRQTVAIFNLVELATPSLSDHLTVHLQSLRCAALSPRDAANVAFALARIHETAGDAEQAFALYQEANAAAAAMLDSLGSAYDAKRAEVDVLRVIDVFSPEVFADKLESLDIGLRMIFIVGMPRSGTTLIERILSSHTAVDTGGELPFMQECLARLHADRESNGRHGRIDLGDKRERRLLTQLRDEYIDAIFERDLDGEYVIDKLPANFSAVGLIRLLFPDAIIVHCARDPMATCWSLYTAHFGTHLAYYTSLEHLAHYYNRVYRRLMGHWNGIFGSDIITVSYDDLLVNFESGVRNLLRCCGLPWQDACLRFSESAGPVYTASMLQVRRPIDAASASRWRSFERYLSPLATGLRHTGCAP